jgi:hypothetical protein
LSLLLLLLLLLYYKRISSFSACQGNFERFPSSWRHDSVGLRKGPLRAVHRMKAHETGSDLVPPSALMAILRHGGIDQRPETNKEGVQIRTDPVSRESDHVQVRMGQHRRHGA